jgi:hemolysin activation/secretion protein
VDNRIHVADTNGGPRFAVDKYLVLGNSALPPRALAAALTNIDGAFGTNVSFAGIQTAVAEIQRAYRDRGYVTVAVGLPQQKLTNATVKVQVNEGRLAVINVTGNHYFSSNNVLRALPGLHTNLLLNGPAFQAELNRANGNRDRQIYPLIGPGPEPGSSALTLKVKDQLPVHGKIEFNNQSTPGTPDLRVNASAETDNLWQLEHALGVQYGFSPADYKPGDQWDFYDLPAVANYSAFYRLPLGNPEPVAQQIADSRGNFGYNEATHRLNLPPVTTGPGLTLFASRSTIDDGVATLSAGTLYNTNGNRLDLETVQQDATINSDLGFRLSAPWQTYDNFHSVFSFGPDYKHYELNSGRTNIFTLTSSEILYNPPRTNIVVSKNYSPVPYTVNQLDYLPLTLSYNAGWQDSLGAATFGLDLGVNLWYSSQTSFTTADTNGAPVTTYLNGSRSLQYISGSTKSSGHWVVLRPSFTQQIVIHSNWLATFRADGQWASEPLISNEQFGVGGVNSVRGYYEGEAFGDTGWHFSLEQQTPTHQVGMVHGNQPLTVRGLAFMDYAAARLLDPQGRDGEIQLWSTGLGLAAAIGSHWQSQFLVSLPLIGTALTPRYQPRFNFVLTAQF